MGKLSKSEFWDRRAGTCASCSHNHHSCVTHRSWGCQHPPVWKHLRIDGRCKAKLESLNALQCILVQVLSSRASAIFYTHISSSSSAGKAKVRHRKREESSRTWEESHEIKGDTTKFLKSFGTEHSFPNSFFSRYWTLSPWEAEKEEHGLHFTLTSCSLSLNTWKCSSKYERKKFLYLFALIAETRKIYFH